MGKSNKSTEKSNKSYCGRCSKLVKVEGIYYEGNCESWYHPQCANLEASEYVRLSQSPEERRCENCQEYECEERPEESQGSTRWNVSQEDATAESGEGTVEREVTATEAKLKARKRTVERTYDAFAERTVYTECELETILKEHYRKEREQNGVKDTNVTNTLKSLKGEVLSRLEPRESKGIKLNTHSVGQQWPQLRALLAHLVERIEELETAATHKDKRIEVLTRKIQLIEEQQKEEQRTRDTKSKESSAQEPFQQHTQVEKHSRHQERKERDANTKARRRGQTSGKRSDNMSVTPGNHAKSDLIRRPIIVRRRQRPDKRYDSRGHVNRSTQERTSKASKNSERHRKRDRAQSDWKMDKTRSNKRQSHEAVDKVLNQLNLFNQAITEYVKATVQGSPAAPRGSTQ